MSPATMTPPDAGRHSSAVLGAELEHAESVSSVTTAHFGDVMAARVPAYHGVVLQKTAAVVMAEFEEPADAVNCAIDVQDRFAQYNKLHLDDGRAGAKIGIHYGEVYFSGGEHRGSAVDTTKALLSMVPACKIYITRNIFVRVRMLLPLKFENVGKKALDPLQEPSEILSVVWEAVAGNLQASLKKLDEDDLQRATRITSTLGLGPSKRASPVVLILILIFLFALFKFLKWI